MNTKHKVLKDYQLPSIDGKIVVIKSGSMLEDYKFKTKSDSFSVDKILVDQNPEFFLVITWKDELHSHIKNAKIAQPKIISNKIIPFIEERFTLNNGDKKEEPQVPITTNYLKEEYEYKLEKVNKKEKELETELKRIEEKEKEFGEKYKELREREEQMAEKEIELNNIERSINNNSLSHDEFQKKMDKEIEELSKREKELQEKISKFSVSQNAGEEFARLVMKNTDLQATIDKIKLNVQKLLATKPYLKNYHVDIERIFD